MRYARELLLWLHQFLWQEKSTNEWKNIEKKNKNKFYIDALEWYLFQQWWWCLWRWTKQLIKAYFLVLWFATVRPHGVTMHKSESILISFLLSKYIWFSSIFLCHCFCIHLFPIEFVKVKDGGQILNATILSVRFSLFISLSMKFDWKNNSIDLNSNRYKAVLVLMYVFVYECLLNQESVVFRIEHNIVNHVTWNRHNNTLQIKKKCLKLKWNKTKPK